MGDNSPTYIMKYRTLYNTKRGITYLDFYEEDAREDTDCSTYYVRLWVPMYIHYTAYEV